MILQKFPAPILGSFVPPECSRLKFEGSPKLKYTHINTCMDLLTKAQPLYTHVYINNTPVRVRYGFLKFVSPPPLIARIILTRWGIPAAYGSLLLFSWFLHYAIFAQISLLGTTPCADVITSQALWSRLYTCCTGVHTRWKKATCSASARSPSFRPFFQAAKFYSHVMLHRFYFCCIKPLAVGIK